MGGRPDPEPETMGDASSDPGAGESNSRPGDATSTGPAARAASRQVSGPHRNRIALGLLLALVAAVRLLPLPSVYRDDHVVLPSNDPYYYRYWVEQLSRSGTWPLDPGLFAGLPPAIRTGEPLTVATLASVTNLLGGGPAASGTVLAWYPVLSALVTGVLVYLLAVSLTDDPRVGLAAVGLFAVVPGHAFRTSIGFADHHAFDYPWLALTAVAVVLVLDYDHDPDPDPDPGRRSANDGRQWLAAGALGIGVAGQTLSWNAAPLLLVPLTLSLVVIAPLECLRRGSARPTLEPIAGGLTLGSLLVGLAHLGLGWQTTAVAIVPLLLLAGTGGLLVAASIAESTASPGRMLAGIESVVLLFGLVLLATVPIPSPDLATGIGRLFGTTGVAEAASVVHQFGVVFGPLIMLGFAPLLGVPVMFWGLGRAYRRTDPAWAVVAVYGWFFLAISFVQRRFTGELAPFIAIFGGLGFLALASWLDLLRPPVPFVEASGPERRHDTAALELPGRRRLAVLAPMALVGVGFPTLYTSIIQDRVSIDQDSYRAVTWMREYARTRGWTYPASYVLSPWGRNRMYNYFVNGHSRSYGYARRNYDGFILSNDAEAWYERLHERVGFVVTHPIEADLGPDRLHRRLHETLGSAAGRMPGLAHYRAMYASPDGAVKVFTLVPGATLVGETTAAQVRVETKFDLTVPSGTDGEWATTLRTYVRRTESEDGRFAITVAHPGTYAVSDGDGTTRSRVEVSTAGVTNGETIDVSNGG